MPFGFTFPLVLVIYEGLGYLSLIALIVVFHPSIPFVDDNRHYQEYLDWVAEGNTAEAAD